VSKVQRQKLKLQAGKQALRNQVSFPLCFVLDLTFFIPFQGQSNPQNKERTSVGQEMKSWWCG
jgi:hypothetical protein